jgi:hypothetical protein
MFVSTATGRPFLIAGPSQSTLIGFDAKQS